MTVYHTQLTEEKWSRMERSHQILNIASELNRARNNLSVKAEYVRMSLERALELIDFTVCDRAKWSGNRLRELLRFREVLAEHYIRERQDEGELKTIVKVLLSFNASSSEVRP